MELQWPLILFTTLLAWAAGVFGAQCLYALRGQGTRAQMPALITSAVLLVVGGIAVFFHLEHWERIFNGFGHLTSGITQELIAIVVLAVVMVVYFVYLRRGGDEAKVPAWLAAVGLVLAAWTPVKRARGQRGFLNDAATAFTRFAITMKNLKAKQRPMMLILIHLPPRSVRKSRNIQ